MKRLGLLLCLALTVLFPSSAQAQVLPPDEAAELVETLQDATQQQGVCYGWRLLLNDAGIRRIDSGSNEGLSREPATGPACSKALKFVADVTWTSEMSEAEDSASYSVMALGFSGGGSGWVPASRIRGLDMSNFSVSTASLTDSPEDEVQRAVRQLPGLAAASGFAPWVEVEPNTQPLAAGDAPTGSPGSDWMRTNGGVVVVLVLGFLGASAFAIWQLLVSRSETSQRRSRTRTPRESKTLS